jgi:aminomethyltransferase
MAYVEPGVSEVGTALEVDVRGKRVAAEVVKLPFYRRSN